MRKTPLNMAVTNGGIVAVKGLLQDTHPQPYEVVQKSKMQTCSVC